mmetsp:Transcript_2466/g.3878  ORF Transcript_2466/g.3878 Transcript_2466/m.3878 type:complete len:540 (-) Transcript_2466:927-2546(-)
MALSHKKKSMSSSTAPKSPTSPSTIENLPETLLTEIVHHLTLSEQRRFFSTSSYLWNTFRCDYECNVKHLVLSTEADAVCLFPSRTKKRKNARRLEHSPSFTFSQLNNYDDDNNESEEEEEENFPMDNMTNAVFACQYLYNSYNSSPGRLSYLQGLTHLVTLDLRHYATDAFLVLISGTNPITLTSTSCSSDNSTELLPNLQTISMIQSHQITDQGLYHLSLGSYRAQHLQYIDITLCRNTTYAGTFPLRDNLTHLKVLRRQPKWLDGIFLTPFGKPPLNPTEDEPEEEDLYYDVHQADRIEKHIYYADGTFQFERETQSAGFVADLFDIPNEKDNGTASKQQELHHLGDKLQYNNFDVQPGWPDWSRYYYRPGVALVRLPDVLTTSTSTSNGDTTTATTNQTATVQSVLVLQNLRGMKPPTQPINLTSISTGSHPYHSIPLGQSRYFLNHTTPISQDEIDQYIHNPHQSSSSPEITMITKMKKIPLVVDDEEGGENNVMPPNDLVERNQEFCKQMVQVDKRMTYLGSSMEEYLHELLL